MKEKIISYDKRSRSQNGNRVNTENNDVDSTTSGSRICPNNSGTNCGNVSTNNEDEENMCKETPHFFPVVEKKNNIETKKKPKSARGIPVTTSPSNNKLILPKINKCVDEKVVNNELTNLFENISDNLINDPDVKEKVDVLLKNINDFKNFIYKKKNIQSQRENRIKSSKSKDTKAMNKYGPTNESLINGIQPCPTANPSKQNTKEVTFFKKNKVNNMYKITNKN